MASSDDFYLKQDEPFRSCLLSMREIILSCHPELTNPLKYGMPFFCFRGKMICYLWIHKKYRQPYLGLVDGKLFDHPGLLQEKRARMKILLTDPCEDLPAEIIKNLIAKAIEIVKTDAHYAKSR